MNAKMARILAIGIGIRLVLMPFFAHPFDILNWYNWVVSFNQGRFTPLFVPPYLLAYVFAPIASLYAFLEHLTGIQPIPISQIPVSLRPAPVFPVDVVPSVLFNTVAKIPFVISDVLVALLLFSLVKRETNKESIALASASLWFLNPLVIWVSSGWGQYDSLPVLFTVFALYLAVSNRFFLSAIALSVATSLKLYPAVLFVPLAIYAWKRGTLSAKGKGPVFKFTLGLALTLLPLSLFADKLVSFFYGWLVYPEYPATPGSGLTYWSWSFVLPLGQTIILVSLAVGMLLVAYTYRRIWLIKFEKSLPNLSAVMVCCVIAILLTTRFVGENFIVWILPFCAVLVVHEQLERSLFWIVSLLAFAFSITNSLLPFYMLPLAPYIGPELSTIVDAAQPYRITQGGVFHPGLSIGTLFASSVGTIFSICLVLVFIEVLSTSRNHLVRDLCMRIRSFVYR